MHKAIVITTFEVHARPWRTLQARKLLQLLSYEISRTLNNYISNFVVHGAALPAPLR